MHVTVAGGGIGGLTAALALRQRGIEVAACEAATRALGVTEGAPFLGGRTQAWAGWRDQKSACYPISRKHADSGRALINWTCDLGQDETQMLRLPLTADIVRANRKPGLDAILDLVEVRAPDGFAELDSVIPKAELANIVGRYKAMAGHRQKTQPAAR